MTQGKHKDKTTPTTAETVTQVMERVGIAQASFELRSIRFIEFSAKYSETLPSGKQDLQIGVSDQTIQLNDDALRVLMRFDFQARSPIRDESNMFVDLVAHVRVEYQFVKGRKAVAKGDAELFGKVNSIYNAWPFFREYVHSGLTRLGLPAFELPLLRVGAAVQLAGLSRQPERSKLDQKPKASK